MTTYFRLRFVAMVTRQALKNVFYKSGPLLQILGRQDSHTTAAGATVFLRLGCLTLVAALQITPEKLGSSFVFQHKYNPLFKSPQKLDIFNDCRILSVVQEASTTSLMEHSVSQPTECRFFAKNLMWVKQFFDDYCSDLSKLGQKSAKFDFQSHFPMSKIGFIILIFFPFRILDQESNLY